MQRLFYKVLLFLPIPIIMVAISILRDPAHLFNSTTYLEGVVQGILEGKNVANLGNYDERIFRKMCTQSTEKVADVLALGSSRSSLINKDFFPNNTFFNNWVSGAVLEDILGMYKPYTEKKHFPSKVILSIDPWMLNKNHGADRWLSLHDEYAFMRKKILNVENQQSVFQFKKLKFNLIKIKELLSIDYFRKALKNQNDTYYFTDKMVVNEFILLSDGSRRYRKQLRENTRQKREQLAKDFIAKDAYHLSNFHQLDIFYQQLLEKFIQYLKQQNIEVHLFLSPYQPIVWDHFAKTEKYSMVSKTEKYLQSLAIKENVKVIGSYNPNNLQLNSEHFIDGMHLNRKGMSQVFNN